MSGEQIIEHIERRMAELRSYTTGEANFAIYLGPESYFLLKKELYRLCMTMKQMHEVLQDGTYFGVPIYKAVDKLHVAVVITSFS